MAFLVFILGFLLAGSDLLGEQLINGFTYVKYGYYVTIALVLFIILPLAWSRFKKSAKFTSLRVQNHGKVLLGGSIVLVVITLIFAAIYIGLMNYIINHIDPNITELSQLDSSVKIAIAVWVILTIANMFRKKD